MADETFLTTEELLEYLQVNLRTIYRLIKAELPAVRVGRQWRFSKREVDSWLSSQRTGGVVRRAPSERPAQAGSRVLIVDDEESVRGFLARLLESNGFVVDQAKDGAAALERLHTQHYDLLIVDLMLPGVDGLTVARIARQTHQDVRVIVITGFSTEERAREAANIGVNGYLVKPFAIDQVVGAVTRALARTA
jgi:excisionase family DNA binding protein